MSLKTLCSRCSVKLRLKTMFSHVTHIVLIHISIFTPVFLCTSQSCNDKISSWWCPAAVVFQTKHIMVTERDLNASVNTRYFDKQYDPARRIACIISVSFYEVSVWLRKPKERLTWANRRTSEFLSFAVAMDSMSQKAARNGKKAAKHNCVSVSVSSSTDAETASSTLPFWIGTQQRRRILIEIILMKTEISVLQLWIWTPAAQSNSHRPSTWTHQTSWRSVH